jgi:hypothetical protein
MEWLKKEEEEESISAKKTVDQNKMMSRTNSAHCQFT